MRAPDRVRVPIIRAGQLVSLEASELREPPTRPGAVMRVERGAYGFEAVLTAAVSLEDRDVYRGEVTGVWGQVPCE